MTQEFIPYDLALELKELGFDEPCFTYYKNDQLSDILELVKNSEMENVNNEVDYYISAPTFSQAFRWFRDKYEIISEIRNWNGTKNQWYHIIHEDGTTLPWTWVDNTTYEEAELACLEKLIEIIKNK